MASTTTTTATPEMEDSEFALVKLSRRIDIFYIPSFRVVISGLDITKTRTSQKSALNDLFGCVKEKITDKKEALTFLYQVLEILGWSDLNDLEPYILSPANYDTRTRYKGVDIRLTVLEFINSLEECDFEILRACVCSHCGVAVDRIENRAILVEVIFDEVIKKDKDVHVTLIYHIARCFNREQYIMEYCERQNISLPEVNEDSDGNDLVNKIQLCKKEASTHFKAGETDKHNETSEIQGENKLSLSTGPSFPSKPITDDDGSSPREVEADQPKKRKDCVIQQVQNVRGMKKEKDKDVDDISQSRSKTDETTEKERRNLDDKTDSGSERKVKSNTDKWKKRMRTMCVCFSVPGLVILGAVVCLLIELISQSQNGSVNITDSSLVALNPDGFRGDLNQIQLTLETEDENKEVEVFKQPCDEVSVSSHNLTVNKMQELVSNSFNRQAYNYNGEDKPIYGVEGSVLYFIISSNASDANQIFCPRLSIFNNNNLYQVAIGIHVNVEGNIAQSPCFPVNTSDNPAVGTWSYTFENSEYIYVTIEKGGGVVVNGMISGTIRLYEKMADPVKGCSDSKTLISESRTCRVDICEKECITYNPPKQCIFLQSFSSSNSKIRYETERACFTFKAMICLIVAAVVLLLYILLVYLGCKHVHLSSCILHCTQCIVESDNIKLTTSPTNGDYQLIDDNTSKIC